MIALVRAKRTIDQTKPMHVLVDSVEYDNRERQLVAVGRAPIQSAIATIAAAKARSED